jgi:16S rRNA (cytosine967-C5)-methyltransferase
VLQANSRRLAQNALRQWRTSEQFADAILGQLLRASDLAPPDRAFATELFYGVLRNLTLLDFWIDCLRSKHLDHDTRDLLRLGLYQLLRLETPEHAAVFETVALAARKSRAVVNAVLRNATRRKEGLRQEADAQSLSIRKSHPQFLVDRWTQNFGREDSEALCDWNNRPAPVYARINRIKILDSDFLLQHPEAKSLPQADNFVHLTSIPQEALRAGHCYIQDPSTVAACRLLDPKPGERVLDACAAPGGKTGYLAELMENAGFILGADRDPARVAMLRENLERLGVTIGQCLHHDWAKGDPLPDVGRFDRILIDTPCTNTGVMRRRVDLRWRLAPEDFLRMPAVQLQIVRTTMPLLKPGGFLVYSTCSIEPEENDVVVRAILQEFPSLRLLEQVSSLPFRDGFDGAFAAKFSNAS